MDIQLCGARVRAFAATACVLLGTVWTGEVVAQSAGPYWNEKVSEVNEPFNVRSRLRLGAAVGAGGNFILSQGGDAVYVSAKNAQGNWAQTAKLVAPGGGVLTGPIAFDGTHALIRGYDTQKTSVVVHYFWDGTRWRTQGVLKGTANFGTSIALDGCNALISSSYEVGVPIGGDELRPRFVHHFDRCRSGTGSWTWVGSIPGASYGGGYLFGTSLSLNGNTAIVGDVNRVHHFTRSGDTWRLVQTIEEAEPQAVSLFGYSVAVRDNLLLIGARGRVFPDENQEGFVIHYTWNGAQWVRQRALPVPRGPGYPPYEDFGRKILITSDRVYITAPAVTGRYTTQPFVFSFQRVGLGDIRLNYTTYLADIDYSKPFSEAFFGYITYGDTGFGTDIAVSGDSLVVGAPKFIPYEKAALVEGRTTVYTLPPVQPAP